MRQGAPGKALPRAANWTGPALYIYIYIYLLLLFFYDTVNMKLKLSHSVIHSTDSFERLIHSEMKQVAVFMNGSPNHWLKNVDSFINETP